MQRKAEHYKRKFVKGHQVSQLLDSWNLDPINMRLARNKMDLETWTLQVWLKRKSS